jgi:hypothetical protein
VPTLAEKDLTLLFGFYFNLLEYLHDRFSRQVLKPAFAEPVIDAANVD